MHEITYLNCTLTVSSNQHVGFLEKKKRHYQSAIVGVFFFFFSSFLEEAAEKQQLFLSLTLEVYLISKGLHSFHFQDASEAKSLYRSYITLKN